MSFFTYLHFPPSRPQPFFMWSSMSGTCPIIHLTHGHQKQPHKGRKELIAAKRKWKETSGLIVEGITVLHKPAQHSVIQIEIKKYRPMQTKQRETKLPNIDQNVKNNGHLWANVQLFLFGLIYMLTTTILLYKFQPNLNTFNKITFEITLCCFNVWYVCLW